MESSTYLMTSSEVAALLGVQQRQVSRMVNRGDLTPSQQLPDSRGRGAYLFPRAAVEALAVQRECDRAVAR